MTAEQASLGRGGGNPRSVSPDAIFARLYDDYYDRVFGYCLRRTDRTSAEDATAEVFVIAWTKLPDVPPGEKALSWLYGVAFRVMCHQWRGSRRRHNLVTRIGGLRHEPAPDPERQVVRQAEDRRVLEAASRLKDADREILRLAGWEALPHHEIAQVLGMSVAAVDQRFSRAKKRLAKEYDRMKAGRPPNVQERGSR